MPAVIVEDSADFDVERVQRGVNMGFRRRTAIPEPIAGGPGSGWRRVVGRPARRREEGGGREAEEGESMKNARESSGRHEAATSA